MKKNMFIMAVATLGLVASAFTPNAITSYKVDAAKSSLKWHAKKVTGEHHGTVRFADGSLAFNGNTLTGGTINMDMTTIDVTDLTGEWKDKLVGHLKSDDFFSSAKHNNATMIIKSATAIKGAAAGTPNYTIQAELTIKGIKNMVTFPATVTINGNNVSATATFPIDRTKYDIKYGSGSFFSDLGDKAIDDSFTITVNLVAVK